MTPVLFLDFDGPVFPDRGIRLSPNMSQYPGTTKFHQFIDYWEMDRTSVRQLNNLYEIYPFDTVISSSWRHYCTLENIVDLFQVNSLNLHLHEVWATPHRMSSYRLNEINWWLDEVTISKDGNFICPSHIILDDPWSGSYLQDAKAFGMQEAHLVNPDVGIDSDIFNSMKSIVTGWRDDFETRNFIRIFPKRDWDGIVPVETR